jgi:hypothetical protein
MDPTENVYHVPLRVHWSITSAGRDANDIENVASSVIALPSNGKFAKNLSSREHVYQPVALHVTVIYFKVIVYYYLLSLSKIIMMQHILKRNLRETGRRDMDWIDLAQERKRWNRSRENGNKLSGYLVVILYFA